MSKRLILILALAFVLGFSFAAYAEVQNVKLSGDLTILGIGRDLSTTGQKAESAVASIVRLRVDADLTDNVSACVRLINERYWGSSIANYYGPTATVTSGSDNTNIDLDLAYVTLKEFLYSPLTLTVGRQELHFGNDMIIGAATTNNHATPASVFSNTIDKDLSMRKSFDAVRATLNYDPLVIDIVGAEVSKGFRNQPGTIGTYAQSINDQETLVGVNANYELSKTTDLEAYFWQRARSDNNSGATVQPPVDDKTDRVDVVGGRIVNKSIKNLTAQAEVAHEGGTLVNFYDAAGNPIMPTTQHRDAWAAEGALTYDLKDVNTIGKYKPTITALAAYFSGNRGKDKTNTGWDPMYENQKFGDIANEMFNQTDADILGAIVTAKPMSDVTLKGEYYAFWWDKRFGSGQVVLDNVGQYITMNDNRFAGQEVDLTATYDYTEDVQFSLLGGILKPGSSFNKTRDRKSVV